MKSPSRWCLAAVAAVLGNTLTAATWYVDASDGDDTASGATPAEARRTLAGAMAIPQLADEDVVVLMPGTYAAETMSGSGTTISCRAVVSKAITVKSLLGRATRDETVIVGASGDTPIRGLFCAANVTVEGITFSNCWAQTSGNASLDTAGGGLAAAQSATVRAVDCRFTRCGARTGGGMELGFGTKPGTGCAVRCEFDSCFADIYGSAVRAVPLCYCYLHDFTKTLSKTPPVYNTGVPVVNCTFFMKKSSSTEKLAFSSSSGPFLNCVLLSPMSMSSTDPSVCTNFAYSCNAVTEKCVEANRVAFLSGYMSPNAGDLRPQPSSGFLTSGNASFMDAIPEEFRTADFNGDAVTTSEGKVAVGCFLKPGTVDGGYLDFQNSYAYELNGIPMSEQSYARHYVSDRREVLRVKPIVGDGEAVYCITNQSGTAFYPDRHGVVELTVPNSGALKVSVVKATGVYTVGAGEAYATIQSAVDAALDRSVVFVKPGTYATGEPVASDAGRSRVTIPSGKSVHLFSTGGAAVTEIVGAPASEPVGSTDAQKEKELGSDAVRCLAVLSDTAVVDGFTLRDGHTDWDGVAQSSSDAYHGGGVYAVGLGAMIRNCVITNCFAYRGGGAFCGHYRNCAILACRAVYHSSAATQDQKASGNLDLVDCYLDDCWGGWRAVFYSHLIRGCTFGPNIHGSSKTDVGVVLGSSAVSVEDTLFLCEGATEVALAPVNCAAVPGLAWKDGSDLSDCVTLTDADWDLASSKLLGRVDAQNPAVGKGIGRMGEDWSSALAPACGIKPGKVVFDASSADVRSAAAGVRVVAGTITTGEYAGNPRNLSVTVSGNGKLVVREDGKIVSVGDKDTAPAVTFAKGKAYALTYYPAWAETDSPGYVLAGSQSASGLILFFR